MSFIVTPPFPDYTSGHSTFSAAAATVLPLFYGTEDLPFTTGSDFLPGVFRSFSTCHGCSGRSGSEQDIRGHSLSIGKRGRIASWEQYRRMDRYPLPAAQGKSFAVTLNNKAYIGENAPSNRHQTRSAPPAADLSILVAKSENIDFKNTITDFD